jgi:hypothetical protein
MTIQTAPPDSQGQQDPQDAEDSQVGRRAGDVPALVQAAFKHIRARDFDAARPIVERAQSLAPQSGVAAHARLHLDTDACAIQEGAAFGLAFLTAHDPFDGINVHNAWHLAALLLEGGRPAAALDWHERVVTPAAREAPMTFYGATTLLWRLELYGHGRARGAALPWEAIREAALALPEANERADGSADLDDLARAMAFIATGDDSNLAALLARLQASRNAAGRRIEVVLPLVRGLEAWWRGDDAGCVAAMAPIGPALASFSQYPEHRVPLEDTLLEGQLRSGAFGAAEAHLRQRIAGQASPLPRDLYWLGRALHGQGRREEAGAALVAARRQWEDAEPDSPEGVALEALLAA